MDPQWAESSEPPQRTGSENEVVWNASFNENLEVWLEPQLSFDVNRSVSDDNHSLSGSDDQHILDVAGDEQSYHQGVPSISEGPSTLIIPPIQDQRVARHICIQNADTTPSRDLRRYITEVSNEGVRSFFCAWQDCKHPVGFATKPKLMTHIRSAHLQEKPFVCITCEAKFTRKQDANRHAAAMNLGKQYKCSACRRAFSRKHYRDTHEEQCLIQNLSHQNPSF
ncbi:hypothetical protein JB92DRAFT_2929012 [Gautieria morchelliformis]|nr:hypothetical protein JB92DRAFT_2929012 [Gautieria morchelliformis]